ncbi:MAG: hypothetical protein J0L92_15900 [Deltaproteobacteria bacterium]|nr:hypothetical protein [Deltaproteobacteria bacterium]
MGRSSLLVMLLVCSSCGEVHEAGDVGQDADERIVGLGDRCVPESIPEMGFTSSESYVETMSVQCATRACLVYRLDGHPERVVGTDSCPPGPASSTCVEARERDERVFCSCRCSLDSEHPEVTPCTCTEGFHCVDLLRDGSSTTGYCLPEVFCEDDVDCATGRRCEGHVCS